MPHKRSPVLTLVTIAFLACIQAGCAGLSSRTAKTSPETTAEIDPVVLQVERGRPNKFVDGVGWVFGIPGKVIFWDRRVNNHNISDDTALKLQQYLEINGLEHSKIRLNQYAPWDECKRLVANKEVGAGWRYTVGAWSVLGYTVFPGRVFGGDRYNPYTDTLYVYSDAPALSVVGAAYAKDVHSRRWPGTYAFIQEFPILNMWHETIATSDALAYTRKYGSQRDDREANHLLYPRFGLLLGGDAAWLASWGALPFELAGVAAGHAVGRWKSRDYPDLPPPLVPDQDQVPPEPGTEVLPNTSPPELLTRNSFSTQPLPKMFSNANLAQQSPASESDDK